MIVLRLDISCMNMKWFGYATRQRCDTFKCGDETWEELENFTWW